MTETTKRGAKPQPGFNARMERLRAIVEELEGEDLDLERGVELYKEACECVRWCGQKLKEAKNELETQRGELVDAERFLQEAGDAFERAPDRRRDGGHDGVQDCAQSRGKGRARGDDPFSPDGMDAIPF